MNQNTYPAALTIIIGMPGSGKTTLIDKLLAAGKIDAAIDDYQNGAPDEHRADPRYSPRYEELCSLLKAGKHVAISEIRYCVEQELGDIMHLIKTEWPTVPVQLICFENNPRACKHNVLLRGRPQERIDLEFKLIDEYSPNYQPSGNDIRPVIMG